MLTLFLPSSLQAITGQISCCCEICPARFLLKPRTGQKPTRTNLLASWLLNSPWSQLRLPFSEGPHRAIPSQLRRLSILFPALLTIWESCFTRGSFSSCSRKGAVCLVHCCVLMTTEQCILPVVRWNDPKFHDDVAISFLLDIILPAPNTGHCAL